MNKTNNNEQNNIPIWDYSDDYYYTVINNNEINIRAYDKELISLWIYNNTNNQEIFDDDLSSIQETTTTINTHLQVELTKLPTKDQLLQLQKGKNNENNTKN